MPYAKDPNSARSKRRANRNFTKSRCERRADKRLSVAMGAYTAGANQDAKAFTTPGAQNHW